MCYTVVVLYVCYMCYDTVVLLYVCYMCYKCYDTCVTVVCYYIVALMID